MSDEKMIEVLATVGMNWHLVNGCWADKDEGSSVLADHWNPLTDRNAVAEIEARLTDEMWDRYMLELTKKLATDWGYFKEVRHASPRTCCEALVKVIAPERFCE